jgi:hypothetical protein
VLSLCAEVSQRGSDLTDVVINEIDTSVGDVYEATAHAVWQALRVEHRMPYVGFRDPEMVASWLTRMFG